MVRAETLTAYACEFNYLKRNNPLYDELREKIEAGEKPLITIEEFLTIYTNYMSDKVGNLVIGENADRAITLDYDNIDRVNNEYINRWHLIPCAGRQGKPVMVVDKDSGEKHNYDDNTAALYEHNVFMYEKDGLIIAIFHRQSGSGCKGVFLETVNKSLKTIGVKLEMNVIVPLMEQYNLGQPLKLKLQYVRKTKSSDIADHMIKSKRGNISRELILDLKDREYSGIWSIINKVKNGKLDKDIAFASIKAELTNVDEYNDADVVFKVGNKERIVPWDNVERALGEYDITEKINLAQEVSGDYLKELIKLADEYYKIIRESGDVYNG